MNDTLYGDQTLISLLDNLNTILSEASSQCQNMSQKLNACVACFDELDAFAQELSEGGSHEYPPGD